MQGDLVMNKFKLCSNNYIALVCMWYLYCMLGKLKICSILFLSFTPCFHTIFHCNSRTPSRSLTMIPNFPRYHLFTKFEEECVIKARVHTAEFIHKKKLDARILGCLDYGNPSRFDGSKLSCRCGNSCSEWVWFCLFPRSVKEILSSSISWYLTHKGQSCGVSRFWVWRWFV